MSDEANTESWRIEQIASDPAEIKRRHDANRQAWNEGARHYTSEIETSAEFLREARSNVHPIERKNLEAYGPLSAWCDTAIHLQCAGGRDTLSLAVEGARRVIGVDISDVMIENARELSRRSGISARWYRCDIIETPHTLDATADLVYTGRGAVCWIHDIDAWASVVARLLKPGGVFSLYDGHPFQNMIREGCSSLEFASGARYFRSAGSGIGWSEQYIGRLDGIDPAEESRKYERSWTIAEIVNAVIGAGLVIDRIGEHPEDFWEPFPELPLEQRERIPNTFSLCARKPG
ncbi:MAG: class I SAM-dependent methyltransferase [Spirochaetaceae bacterium]|nr:MAG: class I SAM-dependent methyltransferase [Spirochaetaceae bacterium]